MTQTPAQEGEYEHWAATLEQREEFPHEEREIHSTVRTIHRDADNAEDADVG